MEDKYKNITIDPTQHSYFFTFSNRDCYKLATGRCTFELSSEEYATASAACKASHYSEGRVGYCRELLDSMNEDNSFSKQTGIWGYKNSCGHIGFSDGQHRTCIAKKNNIKELMFDYLGDNGEHLCPPCRSDKEKENQKVSIWNFFRKEKPPVSKGPIDITDDKL